MWNVKTILNPRDFSASSTDAHRTACEIARQCGANIIFLHVTEKPVVSYIERASDLSPEELQEKLWQTLRGHGEFEAGLSVQHRVAEGRAVHEILRAAEETACDLIVMGTRGRSGLSRLFADSVTEEVVFRAPCSVLVARASDAKLAANDSISDADSADTPGFTGPPTTGA